MTREDNYSKVWIAVAIGAAIGVAIAASRRRRPLEIARRVTRQVAHEREIFDNGREIVEHMGNIYEEARKIVDEATELWTHGRRLLRRAA